MGAKSFRLGGPHAAGLTPARRPSLTSEEDRPSDLARALCGLMQQDIGSPRYPSCARKAAILAAEANHLDFALDRWLSPWVEGRVDGDAVADFEPLLALAGLYLRKGLPGTARSAVWHARALDPNSRRVHHLVAAVEEASAAPEGDRLAAVLEEDPWLSREPRPPVPVVRLVPGDRVAERYIVRGAVGSGGMAVVLSVFDEILEEEVALKFMNGRHRTARDVRRFRQEMRVTRRLAHPAIVRVHEFGVWQGAQYFTMELLDGEDLATALDKHGPVPLRAGLRLFQQAAEGLAAAHHQGVVHRDIKPANLFLVEGRRRVKITDFGVARDLDLDASLTTRGNMVGSPGYIAPEVLAGSRGETPADLYALGMVMYEAFTGRLPFASRTVAELYMKTSVELPAPLRDHAPDLPQALDTLVLRMLQKDPTRRLSSAWELAERLSEIRAAVPKTATPRCPSG